MLKCYFYFACAVGNELTGNTNLITHYNLEHAYNKFCGKKVKEKLSNFLPELPGECFCCLFLRVASATSIERSLYTPFDPGTPSSLHAHRTVSVNRRDVAFVSFSKIRRNRPAEFRLSARRAFDNCLLFDYKPHERMEWICCYKRVQL